MSQREQFFPVAGRRAHWVSVYSIGMLVMFLAAVAVLIGSTVTYKHLKLSTVLALLQSPEVLAAIRLSALTSIITLALVVLFSVPVGYALSRYRFVGHSVADTLVDLPIVLPPVVIGVALLVFFASSPGKWLQQAGFDPHSYMGIVLCQFFLSVSYAVRAAKSAFDGVDRKMENLALTLGCTHLQAFRKVALPLAKNGVIAGAIMAWARALGVFGPLMVFVGTTRMKVEVMPTTIYLEYSIGRIEVGLAVAMLMMVMAGTALIVIHTLVSRRNWLGL